MVKLLLIPAALLVAAAACETTSHQRLEARLAAARTDVERGQAWYEHSCRRCHALRMPASHTAEEWGFFVRKYGRKARLTQEQQALVLLYLETSVAGPGGAPRQTLAPGPGEG